MFEYEQDIVQVLLEKDEKFQELHEYHGKLKKKIWDVESGIYPLDGSSLGVLKKEKLLAKDKMALMINRYRRENPT
uniref:Uncharacterized conserved protein YdcH, DUF465 family n=1 Tax=Candidatus Kentrum sp. FM TaxID=2126340 RepID=A0A450RXI3_9GAMM|nr:MAG: Uncharacterized conserved protein YdcH, DUF465 family [Candidatus Kentron sp. FM]VFJ43861.1 MAG: Uncharacterized conserved protein YdcH, DUF465 family [Candidatus Kentron sp. FM]VFK05764.1 MAG: Uncharacterized conserved protein YdcH, DUF465 family [Candidatus Kentron sp. FM]